MAKRRAPIRLLAILVAALVVGPVGAETLVASAARMLDVTNGSELHALKMATIYAADLLGLTTAVSSRSASALTWWSFRVTR
jgi:hypothetical protein